MSYTSYPSYTTLPSQTGQSGKFLTTDGTNLNWLAAGGTGTVTSVGLALPNIFAIAGTNPITAAGTFTVSAATQTANTFWTGPSSGAAAAPTFRAMVATDLPSPIPTAQGGTGASLTLTTGSILFVDGSGNVTQDHTNLNWDDANLRLSIGGHLSTAALGVTSTGGTQVGIQLTSTSSNTALDVQNQGAQFVAQFTNSTNSATQGAGFGGAFSRGTTAAKTAVQAGDQVATWSGQSYNGASFGPGYNAALAIIATENQTSSHNGGEFVIASTPNGTLAPVVGLILGQNQKIQLPIYTTAGYLVNDASGNVTTGVKAFKATWANADGTTKTVTHNLGTTDVLVQVYDLSTNAQLAIGASLLSIVTTSANVVTLTSAAPPATNWRVLIFAI